MDEDVRISILPIHFLSPSSVTTLRRGLKFTERNLYLFLVMFAYAKMQSNFFRKNISRIKYFLAHRNGYQFARELAASEHLDTQTLAELNLQKRTALVRFAFENIPFYRRKYSAAGFELGDLEKDNFFEKLPILEKSEIRTFSSDMIVPGTDFHKLIESTTGGSTGEPLRVYHDPDLHSSILSWRVLNWWGCDVSDNSGYLYRAIPTGSRRLLQSLLLWPTRREWISASKMDKASLDCFLRSVKAKKVTYLVGYVGAIEAFASFLEEREERLDGLLAVWTTAAPLPPATRKTLERIFKCPVYTQYGSCEINWIAAECNRQSGMHFFSDVRHVEVIEGSCPLAVGTYGDLVITDLINKKFPLIRYRLGDRGRILNQRCACGSPFPLLDYVKGRISDAIHTRENGVIPGEYWTTIFDDFTDYIRSFQVYQSKDLSITIYFVPNHNTDHSYAIETVRSRLKKIIGSGVSLNFAQVSAIDHDAGKVRFVVSDV